MRFGHVARHVRAYWSSLRRSGATDDADRSLGAHLQCPVFVINLERSVHRRDYILNYLRGYGIGARIFPAVDGAKLDVQELERQRIYDDALAHQKFSRSLSCAEIACTLSHLGIYRRMVDDDIPMAMVLEDDAMFVPDITSRVSGALSEAPTDWHMLQLSHHCEEYEPLTANLVRFPSKSRMPVGSAGYLIRKSGAEKMLDNSFPVCYPADSLIGRSHRWGLVVYGFAPPVVVQNSVFPTQIYAHTNWRIKLIQRLKQALVSVSDGIARGMGRKP